MARVPSYRLHKPTGQAVVRLNGRDIYLGKHGSPASREAYDRVIREWLAGGRLLEKTTIAGSPSVAEICLAYLNHAEEYYRRRDGSPTRSIERTKRAIKTLREKYGMTPAAEFGPLALQAVRNSLIEQEYTRKYINDLIDEIRRIFKWAASQQHVAVDVFQALRTVNNLRAGRSKAKETSPIRPVDVTIVEATLPHLPPAVRDIIRLLMATGMRPAEACSIRPCDVNHDGDVWVYRPAMHKTQHHGRERLVYLGPTAQAVLMPYLDRGPTEHCFSPQESEQLRRIDMRRRRKSPVQPSQRNRCKAQPKRKPAETYTTGALAKAVRRVCVREGIEPWTPGQLRHTVATELRKQYGIEAAKIILGHGDLRVSEIYAERDHSQAVRIAREAG